MMRSGTGITVLTMLVLMISVSPAYAYIDFGTGSMVFQMLMAGAIGAFFTIKMYWLAFKRKMHNLKLKLTGRPVPPENKPETHPDADR